jgi:PBSX family phage portal protein
MKSDNSQVRAKLFFPDPVLIEKGLRGESQKREAGDPFKGFYGVAMGDLVEPPYDKSTLAEFVEYNPVMGPCIEAMKTNIDGTGFDFVEADVPDELKDQHEDEIKAELKKLKRLFSYCHPILSFIQLRKRLRHDYETTGEMFMEVIRDGKGDICGFEHLESPTMRITRMDLEPTIIKMWILDEDTYQWEKDEVPYRFRRFCQKIGTTTTWFKEFGDPRKISSKTGKEVKGNNNLANEMIYHRQYSPRTSCGIPRYIGSLLSLSGSRKAEELNYNYLRNGKHIPLAILIEGGMLTTDSANAIKEYVKKKGKGVDAAHGILVLEAAPAEDTTDLNKSPGRVGIKFESLVDTLQKDELFQEYIENNSKRIRMAWRLPPLLIGLADDYTRATARESLQYADPQVFAPERLDFDHLMNRLILADMEINFWKFRSNSPEVTDATAITESVFRLERSGGMTPRTAARMAEKVLNHPVKLEMPDEWLDKPLTLIIEEIKASRGQETLMGGLLKTEKSKKDQVEDFVRGLGEIREYLKERGA